jgi:hypothetical protein
VGPLDLAGCLFVFMLGAAELPSSLNINPAISCQRDLRTVWPSCSSLSCASFSLLLAPFLVRCSSRFEFSIKPQFALTTINAAWYLGVLSSINGRIVGGTPLSPDPTNATTPFPYVVSIEDDRDHFCGGFIYNPKWVVTTASCMEKWVGLHLIL